MTDLDGRGARELAGELAVRHAERVAAAAVAREGTRRAGRLAAAATPAVAAPARRLPPPRTRTRWGWRRAVRFAVRNRMLTPEHLILYRRFLLQRLRHPHVQFEGLTFFGRRVQLEVRRHHARLGLGAWCWVGDDARVRAHEGTVRVGPKAVLGQQNVVNAYLDVEIGGSTLLGDWVYVCDFDHAVDRLDLPIRKQGLVKTPTRIGADVWVGEKASVLRGADIGVGSVIGSHTVVRGHIPPFSIAVGAPARVVRSRLPAGMTVEEALALQRAGDPVPGDPLDG